MCVAAGSPQEPRPSIERLYFLPVRAPTWPTHFKNEISMYGVCPHLRSSFYPRRQAHRSQQLAGFNFISVLARTEDGAQMKPFGTGTSAPSGLPRGRPRGSLNLGRGKRAEFAFFKSPPGGHFCCENRHFCPAAGVNYISDISQPL
jgi:hypothetical protein